MRLCLVRHFAPDVASGVCYGQTDLGLMESEQARAIGVHALRERLAELLPDNSPVFSSPLLRCSSLAQALSRDFVADARLRELNFGDWEMQSWDAIGPIALDAWASDLARFRPPGGETGYEVQTRALDWLREVSVRHDHALAITHGGVMRVLQAHHQALPGSNWLKLRYEYGELLCLDFTAEQIHATPVQ